MNWSVIIPLLLTIFQRWLERRVQGFKTTPESLAADQQWGESTAATLEAALPPADVRGKTPVGHDGGIIQHLVELVAALRSGDWAEIGRVLADLLTHR